MKRTHPCSWAAVAALLSAQLSFGAWMKIDDFQGYPKAALPRGANGWQIAEPEFTRVEIGADEVTPGNQAAKLIHKPLPKSHHDVLFHSGALNIAPGQTGTVFLRLMIESGLNELGHTRDPKPVESVQMAISVTEAALYAYTQRAGLALEGKDVTLVGTGRKRLERQAQLPLPKMERNRWYRLWLVIHNAPGGEANHSKAFLQAEGGDGKLVEIPGMLVPEKNYRAAIWKTFGVIKHPNGAVTDVLVDDCYVDNSGENLAYPVSAAAAAGWQQQLATEAQKYAHLLKQPDTWEQAEKQARELLAAMTPDERFELLRGSGDGIPAYPRLGLPLVYVTDAGNGINNGGGSVKARHPRSVANPCTLLLAATWNPETAEAYGRSIGEQCRQGGTHILLGPGMDMYRASNGGRNFEYFGEDPLLAGRQVAAYVRGLQGAGTAATIKHFVCNEIEFHRRGCNVLVDERTLREVYMEPFRMGIEAGAWCVMSAYNQVNGEWCGQSRYVNTGLLRKALGFKGLIMTDWIATTDGEQVAASGTNMEMPGGWSLSRDREKVFGKPEIDRMALPILTTCIYAGFYEHGLNHARPELEAHRAQWEQAARQTNLEGITLLQNGGLLPLSTAYQGRKILVAGNMAERENLCGGGSGNVPGYDNKTYLQAVRETFPGAEVICGKQPPTEGQVRGADLVLLFVGMTESEGRDRIFALPEDELIARCVALNPRTVVCLATGGGVQMDWAEQAAAIVHAYFGGQTGAAALMDILTGQAEPAGRLPFTIERKFEDSPAANTAALQKPNTARAYATEGIPCPGDLFQSADKTQSYLWDVEYQEGVFVGHRWYESKQIPVRFPFGYGLTYTTFAYEGLKTEVLDARHVRVSFTLKNTGKRPGAEVTQVYVGQRKCRVPRPVQELKAFQKVRLAPGESKPVVLDLGPEAFRYWHPKQRDWVIDPANFDLHVGASSGDIRLQETVRLR